MLLEGLKLKHKILILNDPDSDTFGVFVDDMLVYNYDWINLDEALKAVAEAIDADFQYKEVTAEWNEKQSRYILPIEV